MATPKTPVSVSGPSKSGKTVLIEKVVGEEYLIPVSGALIKEPEDLWNRVLDWMDSPTSSSETFIASAQNTSGVNVGGKGSLLAVDVNASMQRAKLASSGVTESWSRQRGGMTQVRREIAGSEFVVLVDDFHYMARDVQAAVARQIKVAAEAGIRICAASVPHRSDDVVRGNPELRGRTANIDTGFWTEAELFQIGDLGFRALGVETKPGLINRFAAEACGSPQLMQSICLETAFGAGLHRHIGPRPTDTSEDVSVESVMLRTSTRSDYTSLVRAIHQGPKTRGQVRNIFDFYDGTKGDVYRCILLAIAVDPPLMTISWSELQNRVARVCVKSTPVGSSYSEACKQISIFALNMYPDKKVLEWDTDADVETLSIIDPYFLFFIRSSDLVRRLAARNSITPDQPDLLR